MCTSRSIYVSGLAYAKIQPTERSIVNPAHARAATAHAMLTDTHNSTIRLGIGSCNTGCVSGSAALGCEAYMLPKSD